MSKRPDQMWAFWANAYGPSFKTPQRVKYCSEHHLWWHKDGDHSVYKVGIDCQGWVCFAHPEKQRVQDFINGFNGARKVLTQFVVGL